ncbi:ubiquitin-like modifier-activating enzyme ATG7 [Dinothrombium tinctorium]|nr:ubiquitin-like modifier-activating enzyme ATG7 [Dinothrombium tinctorium]RWS05981.1 ubiquitin-like modifier-activating enzyme ATG7 [Dinothrombium tinctorium]RWS07809.1 ubiquitin-like modifier-activating enzyme ATG7 [Dinothrombium tinctorium]
MNESEDILQFYPFSSLIDPSFWHIVSEKKLSVYRLNETAIDIFGMYRNDEAKNLPPLAAFSYDSLNEYYYMLTLSKTHFFLLSAPSSESGSYPMFGKLIIYNTLEAFRNANKKELLQSFGEKLWQRMNDAKECTNITELLSQFLLIAFADLKKYHYHYWFAFPVFQYPQSSVLQSIAALKNVWTKEQLSEFQTKISQTPESKKAYFLTFVNDETNEVSIHPFEDYKLLEKKCGQVFFSFADPCPNPKYPGWPLRNFLTLIVLKYKLEICSILSFRLQRNDCSESLLFEVKLVYKEESKCPPCIGWEKNEKQKLGAKFVDLSSTFDPKRLAESAVDLNLKLMRWRLVPSLDLQKISETKCLLLGAGTLGCNVARCLLAWGVKNITFVDNGKVSFSNPVRQSLYEFNDCLERGKPKAEAAADGLKRIYPSANAKSVVLTIPMPGHPVSSTMINEVENDVLTLEQLIESHDCVFLLMDTRESRWLPTVICQSKRKLVINAALGFDTYLVQRHGIQASKAFQSSAKDDRLGCYFCNDVVAPGDSTKNRTLDQECTVTRPGVSYLAAGLAAELMVSVIQHPLGANAPANYTTDDDDPFAESCLGIVPHQIRGFLSQFNQLMPVSKAFDCCTACSSQVVEAYETKGFDFLLQVFKDTDHLET